MRAAGPMHAKGRLIDGVGRVREGVHAAPRGLRPDGRNPPPAPRRPSPAWLVRHLTRVQDDHVADASGLAQVWLSEGWADRFGLGLPRHDTGYGHTPAKVAKVRVDSADLLTGYHDAVHAQTLSALRALKVGRASRRERV